MKTKSVALLGIILGGLFLSFELYLLKFIQYLYKMSGSWDNTVWAYAKDFPCNVALIITVAVIAFCTFIFFTAKGE